MSLIRADRRQFLQVSGATVAAAVCASSVAGAAATPKKFKKALKYGMIRYEGSILEKFKVVKEAGFDGIEIDAPSDHDPAEVMAARDAAGIELPGVVDSVHWKDTLSDADPEVRARGVAALEQALRTCKMYGGTSVLLVPAKVTKQVSYADAYQRSQAEIRKVLPLAAELGVKIAIENVWNQFLLSPLEMARYIDEFESPWIGVHFDVGNIVRFGWPEHWIRTLDKRIFKLDIKEYSRAIADAEGTPKGFRAPLLEGDCDWPAVMQALRDIGYTGWGAAEVAGGGPDRLRDIAERMDRIFAL